MIYELITSDPHMNDMALYKCYGSGGVFYKKVAFTEEANKLLENEKNGYDWFFGDTAQVKLIKKHFYELDMPEFEGRKFAPNNTISGNEETIERIIEYYKNKWFMKDKFAIHGDLALSNIIIAGDSDISIVDWEHFHLADKIYFGFDIIHMLGSCLCHEYRIRWNYREILGRGVKVRLMKKSTENFLRKCYRQLFDGVDASNRILEKPFQDSNVYLKNFYDRFNLKVNPEEKFAIAKYPESELKKLDLIMTKD